MFILIFGIIYFCIRYFVYWSKKCNSESGIEMIVGQIGVGKTSIICDMMVKDLKKGWNVYADFQTNIPGVRYFDPCDLKECLPDEHSVLYIDEGSLVFFSRDFKSFKGYTEFFALSGHRKCKIVLASQSFDVDLYIRNRCKALYLIKRFGCIAVKRRIVKLQEVVTNSYKTGESTTDVRGSGLIDGYKYDSFFAKDGFKMYWLPKLWKWHDRFSLPDKPPLPFCVRTENDEM